MDVIRDRDLEPTGESRPDGVILAIVGSTDPTDREMAGFLIRMAILYWLPIKIVSGGATGIDTMAKRAAIDYDIQFAEFLPKHNRWKPDGYQDRNILIVDNCTHLFRIANRNSRTYGSGWTYDYAKKTGKKVYYAYL